MDSTIKTWHIHIKGLVQGVGYRPLIYKLAIDYNLNGFVKNGTDGLHVIINSTEETAEKFLLDASKNFVPELATISSANKKLIENKVYEDFTIVHDAAPSGFTELSMTPDFALCQDCREEMSDPDNRRFNYGFITCTKCGPRFSIIQSLPYDRARTEMDNFKMCQKCLSEYHDVTNRRYFSQTNSCTTCGVQMSLYNYKKEQLSTASNEICSLIINAWNEGKIVAIKGIGGFLLCCDASNNEAVSFLRVWKNRPSKPLALMYPSINSANNISLSPHERKTLMGPKSPIVLLSKTEGTAYHKNICDNSDRLGVMIPYAPVFQLLLSRFKKPIVATSANKSHSPIIYQNEIAINNLSEIAQYILTNDRNILIPQDDSVITYTSINAQKIILRRSRGLAPNYINSDLELKLETDQVLAMGADLKSSFALFKNSMIHTSPFLGNLSEYEVQKYFKNILNHFLELLLIKPNTILLDKHPEYVSHQLGLKYASEWNLKTLSIQHHHAHFCALLGEHALQNSNDKILGVIWDGTGFGLDDNIWGSEFFVYEEQQFHRCAHLTYFKHIAHDKMSKEPRLSALAILAASSYKEAHLREKFTKAEWNIYDVLLKKDDTIKTSSMGRFFDALASILGIQDIQTYEGEAAGRIEVLARSYFKKCDYHIEIESYFSIDEDHKLHPKEVLEKVIIDVDKGIPKTEIAAKFHLTLVCWIEAVAQSQECKKIGFSGGVFQNSLLVDLIIIQLKNKFKLYFHKDLAPNDENIAFGQLIYASIRK